MTRLRIDHDQQTSKLCSGVTTEECIPCCACGDEEEEEERSVSWIWYLVGSELMVFTLHMSAVIFGVVKVRRNTSCRPVTRVILTLPKILTAG